MGSIFDAYLRYNPECYRHCKEKAEFSQLHRNSKRLVGAYICPGGYVSRVVYFDLLPDLDWFRKFLERSFVGYRVEDRDIRIATRHPWELGVKMERPGEVDRTLERRLSQSGEPRMGSLMPYIVRQVYWSIRRVDDLSEQKGAFRCVGNRKAKGCRRFFVQWTASEERLCPQCRAH